MPHKFNADHRDKIPKQKHRVTNWSEYNESLRQRGDLTVWISEAALGLWSAPRRTTRGGHPRYSDLAVELCLIRRRCQTCWIKSKAQSPSFWQTRHMTENQHLICLLLGSDRRPR